MTIYLYVKTHRKTGLKYLGKTTSKNPHDYLGSGVYWKQHLKKHGNEVITEIIHECKTNDEVKELGLYYSELWNVVESSEWANLKPEEGEGGWGQASNPNNLPHVKELQKKRGKNNNPIHLPGVKEKVKKNTKKAMWDPEIRKKYLEGINSDKWRESRAQRVGNKSPSYDHAVYEWQHKDGTRVCCTQFELRSEHGNIQTSKLVKGSLKTSKGWKIIK